MSDQTDDKEVIIPPAMAELEWVWVLTHPITKQRESIFVIEMSEEGRPARRIVPIFENRDDAVALKPKLCADKPGEYAEQAMRLSEVGNFAAKHKLEIMLLDGAGVIQAHLEARLEQVSVH